MEKYEKVEIQDLESSGYTKKDYIRNGVRLLFVVVVVCIGIYVISGGKKDQHKDQQNAAPSSTKEPPSPSSPSTPSTPSTSTPSSVPQMVDLILLKNATALGAVCLDGSAPGYHFSKGFDSGAENWLVHLEGGGWCNTVESCSKRKLTALGSSKFMEKAPFSGILSNKKSENPDFYNWNKVKVRYCDGASFTGNPNSEQEKSTNLFFRGQLIWESINEELLSLGMDKAKQALLSGCSAGGLAALIHCDYFAENFDEEINVKCLSDAGFFVDVKDASGGFTMRNFFRDLEKFQGVADSMQEDCLNVAPKPFQCLFPRNFVKYILTPVFLVNPSYDPWQIKHAVLPPSPDHGWDNCTKSIAQCNPNAMLKTMRHLQTHKDIGMFIDSCFSHCRTDSDKWHLSSPKINSKTIAESVGDWFFNRKEVKSIDNCPYPCNPTCGKIEDSPDALGNY
ncbi:hypothetical protein MKW94_018236 [Papaver nudicaule]|uniref:Pectin acetylesterase n=1 Tax=Papaver nudicaule TaxID=74823 RepID=A0AA42AZ13_PAPNU|nr:hypothetical protein [Papaver nudicaule]